MRTSLLCTKIRINHRLLHGTQKTYRIRRDASAVLDQIHLVGLLGRNEGTLTPISTGRSGEGAGEIDLADTSTYTVAAR
jgi:hypothetical protein